MRNILIALLIAFLPAQVLAQKSTPPAPAQVAQEVRDYRMDNEDRIVRELSEFLAIPNVASDTPNIQKNAAHLVEMMEARGIETHLLPISGRGPVVFGKLISAEAKRTVIFYAHYDGQPVDPAAWTDGKPFEPVLRDAAIEAGFVRIRPVLMTALAMIIGMVPMAVGLGEGGEQNAPLGRAVIGGLIFATFATLFFVPCVFSLIHGRRQRKAAQGGSPAAATI